MVEAVATPDVGIDRRLQVKSIAWLVCVALFIGMSAGLFLHGFVTHTDETQRELRLLPYLPYSARVDFGYFYAGAMMTWHGEADELYPAPGDITYYPADPIFNDVTDSYQRARLLARGNFYNPPALAYIESPLASLSFSNALWVFTISSLVAFGAFLIIAAKAARGIAELPFLIAGVVAFKPVHEAIIMGHMTLFFVLAITVGFLLLRAKKSYLAGLTLSLLALKPQWAVLPALFLIIRGDWRALFTMGAAASAIFFIPFAITGKTTFDNYVWFLRTAQSWDIRDAPHMFSWNGFMFKLGVHQLDVFTPSQILPNFPWPWTVAYATAPDPYVIYGLIGLTAMLLGIVWLSRDFYLSAAATIVAMLLVSTHSVWYDWALLVVAAFFIVLRPMSRVMRVEMWVVMLAVYLSASQSMAALLQPDRHLIDWHSQALYTVTPAAFLALAWMALVVAREGIVRPPTLPVPAFIRRR